MRDTILEVLNIIYDHGYEAYVVGGYVRDMLLNIPSFDVDINTNATPMELKNIFNDIKIVNANYGAATLYYKKEKFEITTYRKEQEYLDNRHPSSITYVNDLKTDLNRRDFKINCLCIDKDGLIIDLLNGKKDLEERLVDTIDDSMESFQNDALRILRAIRFASTLDFKLSKRVEDAIIAKKHLLLNLSNERKKRELDKIFGSKRAKEGLELIKKYDLINELGLDNLERVKDYSDLIGIWAMINPKDYPFNNNEKDLINKINIVYELDNLDKKVLYQYGAYVNVLAGLNKEIDKKDILEEYEKLPIKNKDEINITVNEICDVLKKEPGSFLKDIYEDLENKIINEELENNNEIIINYLKNNY